MILKFNQLSFYSINHETLASDSDEKYDKSIDSYKHRSKQKSTANQLQNIQQKLGLWLSSQLPAGSVKGSIFTVVISIVGAGCLSLPYGMRSFGLIPGIILLFVSALLSYFTLDLLLISVDYLPSKTPISYRTLAMYSYGNALAIFVQITLLIQFFGATISYIVAYAGLLDLVWSVIFNGNGICAGYPNIHIEIYPTV